MPVKIGSVASDISLMVSSPFLWAWLQKVVAPVLAVTSWFLGFLYFAVLFPVIPRRRMRLVPLLLLGVVVQLSLLITGR